MPSFARTFARVFIVTLATANVYASDSRMPEITAFSARLYEADESRLLTAQSVGAIDATLNRDTGVLAWCITYSGMKAPTSSVSFSLPPSDVGQPKNLIPIAGNLSSPIIGSAVLTNHQISQLLAGHWRASIRAGTPVDGELQGALSLRP